ncbi:hypothetical protein [Rhodococcus zopfii]|uniref:hypothetical protein n=1 Tax=Rhodococcus zopfii TaxID=43772 RepID=UPI0009341246|nr:hypothetical protein [Rhodococcus zopfii]
MTTAGPERTAVDTLISGTVIIERSENSVRTFPESDDSNSVVIERIGPRTHKCPLGTRDAAAVSARVNGRELTLTIGSGRLFKRNYRIVAEFDGRFVSLRPKDIEATTYLNGKPHEIEKEFGEFTLRAGGTVEVFWALPRKVLHKTVEPPVPTVEELLVGYALAAAFGTGDLSLTTIVMGAVASMMP